MSNRNLLRSIAVASAVLLFGRAAIAQDPLQQKIMESLSASAYERVVPVLSGLKAGDRITSKIKWRVFPIERQGKTVGALPIADGWVRTLSGGFPAGSEFGFGSLVGKTGDVLLGEHVFGYLLGGMGKPDVVFTTLHPQYVVYTQATVIAEEEYSRLKSEKADNLGWTDAQSDQRTRIYFKDVSVKETRQLKFTRPDKYKGATLVEANITLAEWVRSFVTIERFKAAEGNLESLAPGTDFWEALFALKMVIGTLDSGITYKVWRADGYLGQAWQKLTPNGYFDVLRFGYVENGREIPKLALIFKNGRVHKVVPHGTQEEVGRHFD